MIAAHEHLQQICAVAFAGEATDAALLLEKIGVAFAVEPQNGKTAVYLHDRDDALAVCAADGTVIALLRRPLADDELRAAVTSAARMTSLARAAEAGKELLAVGRAMGAERDLLRLQNLILNKARRLTNADAGSLLLLEDDAGTRILRFAVAQTGPLDTGTHIGAKIPLAATSIVGSVALSGDAVRIGDAYCIADDAGFAFDSSFDERTGYRTMSVLAVPMRDYLGEIVGVIQLINRKPAFETPLKSREQTEALVSAFDERDEQIALALASQAGVAHEKSRLIDSMQTLFEQFVHASVTAIEVRDVSTQGHSQRVCALTLAQAHAVNNIERGPLAAIRFSPERMQELRYAALLHDFGKLSVPEYIFGKSKKLPDGHLETIRMRFKLAAEQIAARANAQKFEAMRAVPGSARDALLAEIDDRAQAAREDLFALLHRVEQANEPAIVDAAVGEALAAVMQRHYDADGTARPLLDEWEFEYLKIPRGSLSDREREMMNLHVTNSYRFLSALPWGSTPWPRVADIAYSHHEHLDGTGYPRKLKGDELPPEVRMLTIADIYDALTASDRPYKKAVPHDKALDILYKEFAERGKIDRLFLDVFVQHRLHEGNV